MIAGDGDNVGNNDRQHEFKIGDFFHVKDGNKL